MILRFDALPEDAAYDLVVIGAGGAGMSAALFAAIAGAKVLLVEHEAVLGGTTAFSAGTAWIPNTHHAEGAGDSLEKAERFLDRVVGNHSRADLRRAFLQSAPQALAFLERHSHVKFRPYKLHPDYEQTADGAVLRGRALEPVPFDARQLGDAFDLVRPPIPEFTILGGMMVDRTDINHLLGMTKSGASLKHAARLLARHAMDRLTRKRGSRFVMGNALIGRLLLSLQEKGADILVSTSVTSLITGPQGVEGVVLASNGVTRRVLARRGVVLATGGFSRHPQKRGEMLNKPTPQFSPSAPGHTGAMHDLALAAGARYGEGNLDNGFWAPCSIRTRADGSTAVFPHFVLDRSKPGTVCVDQSGRRFVNESTSYHNFARAMFAAGEQAIPCFLIADAEALRKYGLGMVRPGGRGLKRFIDEGYLVKAATADELARTIGVDASALADTLARMNRFAETGEDTDFARGSTDYHRVNGDAANKPNPCLGPIRAAPFYAVRLWPGDIGAANGLVTDSDAQALGPDGAPLGGLYAIGNDMQSIMGGTYPGPGITIGPALVFAWRAVRRALDVPLDG